MAGVSFHKSQLRPAHGAIEPERFREQNRLLIGSASQHGGARQRQDTAEEAGMFDKFSPFHGRRVGTTRAFCEVTISTKEVVLGSIPFLRVKSLLPKWSVLVLKFNFAVNVFQ